MGHRVREESLDVYVCYQHRSCFDDDSGVCIPLENHEKKTLRRVQDSKVGHDRILFGDNVISYDRRSIQPYELLN